MIAGSVGPLTKIARFGARFIDYKMGFLGAGVLAGIVFGINYHGTHDLTGASTAALKQGTYTFLFGGIIMRGCENLATRISKQAVALAAATIIPSALAICLTFGVHNLKGTPKPIESTIPTAVFVIPSTLIWGYRKRKQNTILTSKTRNAMKKSLLFMLAGTTLIFSMFSCRQPGKNQEAAKGSAWLEEITIGQLQQGYRDGKFTVAEVVTAYLARIDSLDRNGPQLNSVIMVNPDALQIAAELDRELASGKARGPLHGIPVVLKDNIDTHDKMPTTAGSRVLKNSFPLADSWVAHKLREAGAVIIGKANLSEWANFRSKFSSSGWSGVGGQTKNPYILDRNPCGSSSGSGVAVSANLCMLAIGTETNGSIVCPSNNNGIVGIKPTVGLISRTGIIPISFTQDTPGPMARTVTDAAICLGILTGIDTADSKTLQSTGHFQAGYTRFLLKDGLKGKRIGLVKSAMGFHHRVDTLMNQTVAWMKSQGAVVVELKESFDEKIERASLEVMLFEFKDGLNSYFASLGKEAPVKTMCDLIAFNKTDSVELRYFDQQLLEQAEAKGPLTSPEYRKALETMLQGTRQEGIDLLMDRYHLDAMMAPTGTPAWKTDLVNGDLYLGGNSSWAAISGYPSITVPMGMIDGLPVGISFFGRAWSEPVLIEIAYGFEQGTKCRRPPQFIKNQQ